MSFLIPFIAGFEGAGLLGNALSHLPHFTTVANSVSTGREFNSHRIKSRKEIRQKQIGRYDSIKPIAPTVREALGPVLVPAVEQALEPVLNGHVASSLERMIEADRPTDFAKTFLAAVDRRGFLDSVKPQLVSDGLRMIQRNDWMYRSDGVNYTNYDTQVARALQSNSTLFEAVKGGMGNDMPDVTRDPSRPQRRWYQFGPFTIPALGS